MSIGQSGKLASKLRPIAQVITEFKILTELLKQGDQVLSREGLRSRALGNMDVSDRTIDVHMAAIRKKLGEMGDRIHTVRGVGYRFSGQPIVAGPRKNI